MLHDSARAISYLDEREDVLVIDDPDVSPSTEVVVHVHTEESGFWHKLLPNHQRTSCGEQFNVLRATLRREELANAASLCLTCFTDYERLLAADADADRRRDTLDQAPLNLREFLDEHTTHGNSAKRRK